MRLVIDEYYLDIKKGPQTIEVWERSWLLDVGVKNHKPCLWFTSPVSIERYKTELTFLVVPNGMEFSDKGFDHIGTAHSPEITLHIFEECI